jgi:hypothetical protein
MDVRVQELHTKWAHLALALAAALLVDRLGDARGLHVFQLM